MWSQGSESVQLSGQQQQQQQQQKARGQGPMYVCTHARACPCVQSGVRVFGYVGGSRQAEAF
eukprot:1158254-Pelagomonas_calceolata.AAC.2